MIEDDVRALEANVRALEERLAGERWLSHDREHAIHAEAHEREHLDYRDRIDVATAALDKRLEAMDAFRRDVSDERATFVRREMLDEYRESQAKMVEANSIRIRSLEVSRGNLDGRIWAIGGALGLLVIVVQIGAALVASN